MGLSCSRGCGVAGFGLAMGVLWDGVMKRNCYFNMKIKIQKQCFNIQMKKMPYK